MKYISTRGGIEPLSFKNTVLMGLATDGGLLLPQSLPRIDRGTLESWQSKSYQDLAFEVIRLFSDDIPEQDLKGLIDRSYATFRHPEIAPLAQKGGVWILELFHGPTLAFKDIALQFLGNLFEYLLQESGRKMNILGATSGDTGSAAIYGVRGKERIHIFILHPHKRVSPVQELQMTTVLDDNVFNLAIKGTFDDGQNIVKSIFGDIAFKEKYQLGAVNSINWARILAQVVYYVSSALRIRKQTGREQVDFSVPTGNFGDIFAGYVAKELLPDGIIRKLILATNENDILSRCVLQGDYSIAGVVQTSSPSMDIQVASNFERYLYYLLGQDSQAVADKMADFAESGIMQFDEQTIHRVQREFAAKKVDQQQTLATIRQFYSENGYVLDPHTSVGVNAGLTYKSEGVPMVCLATAHPGKFSEAVAKAIGEQPLPPELAGLEAKQTRCAVLDAKADAVKQFMVEHALD